MAMVDLPYISSNADRSTDINVIDQSLITAPLGKSSSVLVKDHSGASSTRSLNTVNDIINLLHVYGGRNSEQLVNEMLTNKRSSSVVSQDHFLSP